MPLARPTLAEVQRALAASNANVFPLIREHPVDVLTPVAAFKLLADGEEHAFFLESVEGGEHLGRYSFVGIEPVEFFHVSDGRLFRGGLGDQPRQVPGNAFHGLGEQLVGTAKAPRFRLAATPGMRLPPFFGGAVGFVGYEMMRHLEPTAGLKPPSGVEARMMLFRNVVAFDHVRHRLLLIANIITEPGGPALKRVYAEAMEALDRMEYRFHAATALTALLTSRPVPAASTISDKRAKNRSLAVAARTQHPLAPIERATPALGELAFCDGVKRLKRHIVQGDIFQAVLSDQFNVETPAEPFEIYRTLRRVNPSPYMFFIRMGDTTALGASPEMLVRVENGQLETRPIAGTRKRGETEAEDQQLQVQLLASPKERAEHLMLVDLGRNDLGRVAVPGTVTVPELMVIERYSHVMHIVSSVRAKLARGKTAWDALASCFPAGTVTGAPKIRAMQLVAELEPVPRGLYAGAVVYADFRGNLDSAIAIRSAVVQQKRGANGQQPPCHIVRIQAGAGVVADSQPKREYDEVRNKSRALFEAVRLAETGE